MENPNWGSWPLANIRMANALKTRDYDFHFSFGQGTHNGAQGDAQFPAAMTWLWRNYDPPSPKKPTSRNHQKNPNPTSESKSPTAARSNPQTRTTPSRGRVNIGITSSWPVRQKP